MHGPGAADRKAALQAVQEPEAVRAEARRPGLAKQAVVHPDCGPRAVLLPAELLPAMLLRAVVRLVRHPRDDQNQALAL